jgi:hypothetical protein
VADMRSTDPMATDDWGTALPLQPTPAEEERRRGAAEAAAHCRRLAIGYFEADSRSGQSFAADDDTAQAMLTDLHRRVGDFESARSCAQTAIERGVVGFVREVFRFQLLLCDLGDTACHNADETGAGLGFDQLLG